MYVSLHLLSLCRRVVPSHRVSQQTCPIFMQVILLSRLPGYSAVEYVEFLDTLFKRITRVRSDSQRSAVYVVSIWYSLSIIDDVM